MKEYSKIFLKFLHGIHKKLDFYAFSIILKYFSFKTNFKIIRYFRHFLFKQELQEVLKFPIEILEFRSQFEIRTFIFLISLDYGH